MPRAFQRLLSGTALIEVQRETEQQVSGSESAADVRVNTELRLVQRTLASWMGSTRLRDEATLDSSLVIAWEGARTIDGVLRCATSFLEGNFRACVEIAESNPLGDGDSLAAAEQLLYLALSRAALVDQQTGIERDSNLLLLRDEARRARRLAGHRAALHAHRHSLIAARVATLDRDFDRAVAHFERAIRRANRGGFLHHEAIAREAYAALHFERGRPQLACIHLECARSAYQAWGHLGRGIEIGRRLAAWGAAPPHVLAPKPSTEPVDSCRTVDTHASEEHGIDLTFALRAARSIGVDLRVEEIASRLLSFAAAETGCEFAVLCHRQRDELVIEAAYHADGTHSRSTHVGQAARHDASLPLALFQHVLQRQTPRIVQSADVARWFSASEVPLPSPATRVALPLMHRGRSIGVMYLEYPNASFTGGQLELLQFSSVQAAAAIENAVLYATLEERVKQRVLELEQAYRENMAIAHRAGMAQIAVEVLNNVGGLLNSLSVSGEFIATLLAQSKVAELVRGTELLDQHLENISAFLKSDPRGMPLLHYLLAVAKHLSDERERIGAEFAVATSHIHKLRDIVATQQLYAGAPGVTSRVLPWQVAEDALRLELPEPENCGIQLVREFAETGPMLVDKHKLVQLLIQLISNAKQALGKQVCNPRSIVLSVDAVDDSVRFRVQDTGVGIRPEDLATLFNHGFIATEPHGGLGLHNSAIAAREMNGSLYAESAGQGRGTCLTLTLPRRGSDEITA